MNIESSMRTHLKLTELLNLSFTAFQLTKLRLLKKSYFDCLLKKWKVQFRVDLICFESKGLWSLVNIFGKSEVVSRK